MKLASRRGALAKMGMALGGALMGTWMGREVLAAPARTISMEARRFQFTPNIIALKRGETVRLEITALDFAHGFHVPDLDLRVDLMPGKIVAVDMTAKEVGTMEFLCDNFCGEGHEEMNGQFVVSE